MIVLIVIKCNGATVSLPPTIFDETGGTIGRANTNQMVLQDPDRMISRVHAQVIFRGGNYALIDRGRSDVFHNGRPIGNGREVNLAVGDEIQIGGYLIKVSNGTTAVIDDPFADFAGEVGGLMPPIPAMPRVEFVANPVKVAPKPVQPPAAPASPPWSVTIPEDWDPFHSDPQMSSPNGRVGVMQSSPAPSQSAQLDACFSDLPINQPSNDQSLDALFGLMGGCINEDPLAHSSLLMPRATSGTTSNTDPVSGLLQPKVPVVKTVHDHDSDMQLPWHDDFMVAQPASPPLPLSALPGVVLSWEEPGSSAIHTSSNQVAHETARMAGPAPNTHLTPAHPPAVTAFSADGVAQPADGGEWVQAFLKGLDVPGLQVGPLNADMMFRLGQLLRESTKGTVELLAARTALKSEVRAEVTVVSASANNALKFSPTVEIALQYLLCQPIAGFMGPVDSMRDAYNDLRAHQLGVMAGMRAALSSVLMRFDPAVLEEKLTTRSALTFLIPSAKKARLWELFQALFSQLAHEAEEDFDELFGKAFVREYERCVAQLNSSMQHR